MSCICVDTKVLPQNVSLDVKIISEVSTAISILNSDKVRAEAKLKDLGCKVYAVCKGYAETVKAKVIDSGISVTAYLVCSVGPRDYYYLLVDDGFLLTVDGEYFMVEKNEPVQ